MTKRTPLHTTPSQAHSSEQTVQQLIRLLDESRCMTHLRTSEHFDRALGIWLATLQHAKLVTWLDVCAGMEKALAPLQKALALLMMEGQQNYQDLLGAAYMHLSQGDKRLGQYFTPSGVAKMLAELNFHDVQLPAPGDPPLRIHEPACGSGILILAAAEVIEQRFPGSIARGTVQFFGIDLDPTCVRMAQLNMLIHGIGRIKLDHDGMFDDPTTENISPDQPVRAFFQPAKIIQGDALAPETSQQFLDEARFPWIPIMLQRWPAPTTQAEQNTVIQEQQQGAGAASLFLAKRPGATPNERAEVENATLFALSSEAGVQVQTTDVRPSPERGKRRALPRASADISQPELFPSLF